MARGIGRYLLSGDLLAAVLQPFVPGSIDTSTSAVQAATTDEVAVTLAAEATGRSADEVQRLIRDEVRSPGRTVAAEIERRHITPYEWSDELLAFYGDSDAFIFELIVWNRQPFKRSMRQWSQAFLTRESKRLGRPLRVLCHGDGLGVDALALALDGHDVSYFEFPGSSRRYAQALFARFGVSVTLIEGEHDGDGFDAVTCFDVLEHVPSPRQHVASLVKRLVDPGGVLLTHAPFYLIAPPYPTHLRSNRRYAGRTSLYEREGLTLIDGNTLWNPLALRLHDNVGRCSAFKLAKLKTVGLGLSAGRVTSAPFVPIQKLMRAKHVSASG